MDVAARNLAWRHLRAFGSSPTMWSRYGFGALRRRLIAVGAVLLLGSASGTAQDPGRAAPKILGGDRMPDVIVAPASGSAPVRVYSGADGSVLASDWPFGQGFAGGVRVAAGDLTGDGVPDVVVAMGPGGGLVRIFSGADASQIDGGYPFGSDFTGGIHVAVADVDGDGRADVIAGQGAGGGDVRIYSGADRSLLASGAPFGASYTGGVHVAAGDVTGDSHADVIVGQELGGMARVFSGTDYSIVASHFPYGAMYAAGVHVAAGDVNGDGRQDVIVGPGTGDAPVRVYDVVARAQLASFAAYWPGFPGGARVAAADLTGDGAAEVITVPGPSAPPLLRVFDGPTFTNRASLLVYDSSFAGGVVVAAPAPDPLRITSLDEAFFTVGRSLSVTITTSGGSPRTALAVTGMLPSGITFTDHGGGTATLAGIPGRGTAGTYVLTVAAVTGVGAPVTQEFVLRVGLAPNAPPSFVAGIDQTVLQNSGPHSVPAWATAITAGPPSDEGQTVSFVIAGNTNPALFSAAPAVSPTGTLTYALAPDAFGTATITMVLRDDGGTGDGGMDTSTPHAFTIAVAALQCAPGAYTHDGSSLDGAAYTVKIPDNWNGTLIVYARHYELTRPIRADAFWPGLPEPLFGSSTGSRDFETPLLTAGYALAGSTLATAAGWSSRAARISRI